MVVPRPIIVESRAIVLSPRIAVWTRGGRPRHSCLPKGLICVRGLDCACPVSKCQGRPKRVGEKVTRFGRIAPDEPFVNPESRQKICRRRARLLLYCVECVVQKIGRRA